MNVILTQDVILIDDETCEGAEPVPPIPLKPKIHGAISKTIRQGEGIDLREGVYAVDGYGRPIDYTVEPATLDECDVGVHEVYYSATAHGKTTVVIRKITIRKVADPTIYGNTDIVVAPNEEFDPLDGLTAVDQNGNDVEVEVKE